MNEIYKLSIQDVINKIQNREINVIELIENHIETAKNNIVSNAFITNTFDIARKKAIISDTRYKQKNNRKLEGIPISIKDLFCTENIKTTCGSRMLQDFIPSYNATVVTKIINAGAIIFGKTNMDEFGMGSSNTTSLSLIHI